MCFMFQIHQLEAFCPICTPSTLFEAEGGRGNAYHEGCRGSRIRDLYLIMTLLAVIWILHSREYLGYNGIVQLNFQHIYTDMYTHIYIHTCIIHVSVYEYMYVHAHVHILIPPIYTLTVFPHLFYSRFVFLFSCSENLILNHFRIITLIILLKTNLSL